MAVHGSEGVLIWTNATLSSPVVLQARSPDNSWVNREDQEGYSSWWDPEGTAETKYRLTTTTGNEYSAATLPSTMDIALQTTSENIIYDTSESASIELALSGEQTIPFEASISVETSGDFSDASRTDKVVDLLVFESIDTSDWNHEIATSYSGSAGATAVDVTAIVEIDVEELGTIVLTRASHKVYFSAYEVFWGDLHAHSNLSVDGCEDDTEQCLDRLTAAAEDFFEQALDNDLSFAAITEHAEFTGYSPDGSKEQLIDIWDAQQSLVKAASQHDNFIAILGYEWTHNGDLGAGGHKTVIFDQSTACNAYRIGAEAAESRTKIWGPGTYFGPNSFIAETPFELYAALDAAEKVCDPRRVVTYFHHPALDRPQSANWAVTDNEPDLRYEKVVEIFSEHGSSEMIDPDDDNYFGVDPNKEYKGGGSAERALELGHELGFVGGTDSHDSRPGSLDDGPSCPDHWQDGQHLCQYSGGAITGALATELSRTQIFDAIQSRHTIVSTGPRLALRALVTSATGEVYLPGDVVPVSSDPYELLIDHNINDPEVMAIEVVSSQAVLEEKTEQNLPFSKQLQPQADDWLYLRLTYVIDEEEHRVWVSPWFFK